MIARKMGVPIRRMCAAVNEKDIVHRLIEGGDFVAAPEMTSPFSNAMDIGVRNAQHCVLGSANLDLNIAYLSE